MKRSQINDKLMICAKQGIEQWQRYFLQQAQAIGSNANGMPEHRHNYLLGLSAWLGNTYLQVATIMGDQWTVLVDQYCAQVPLDAFNMHCFEQGFLQILKAQAPEYGDVGRVDYYIHESYYAYDAAQFPFAEMAQLTEQQQADLTFSLASCVFNVKSYVQLEAVWRAYVQADLIVARDLISQVQTSPLWFLIYREEYRPIIIQLSRAEIELLDAIQAGVVLAQMSEQAQEVLPRWIQAGIVVGIQ